jgi:uncharacterized membrane-anchored protein
MARLSVIITRILCLAVIVWSPLAFAEEQPLSASDVAWQTAIKAATNGPSDMPLGDQAILHIPPAMAFVPKAEAATLMKTWGNSTGDEFYGLVVPRSTEEYWVMTIDHTAEGYVKDDDAKSWNADELLQSLKDGTEEQNQERVNMGLPALDIVGWIEKPTYDASSHRLIWSLKAVDHGAAADAAATVNYNTYALGRDGYFQINLLTSDATIEKEKPHARKVLAALEYKPGKRYEDFNESTDHIAEYGLAALIGGVVAKKLGLLALAGVFFLKFAKIIAISLAVAGGGIVKFFRGKRSDNG